MWCAVHSDRSKMMITQGDTYLTSDISCVYQFNWI